MAFSFFTSADRRSPADPDLLVASMQPGAHYDTPPLRVLIVDDTADIRVLVRMALERWGNFVVVDEAADGIAAVASAGLHQPDVVILDAAMPNMDGLTALPLIRSASPDAKVIMLSGFNAGELSANALELGAVGYAVKGQSVRELVAWVSWLVTRVDAEVPSLAV